MSRANDMQGFLPDDYVELKTQRRTNILWALIFLIVAGGIGWAYFIAQAKIQNSKEFNRKVNEDFSAAAKPIREFQQIQEEQKRLNLKAELVGSLVERVNRSNIMAELTNALPKNVYLSDLDLSGKPRTDPLPQAKTDYDRKKVADAGSTTAKPIIFDLKIKVRGYAFNDSQVADYMANLQKSKLFSEVNFIVAEGSTYKELKLRSFELEIYLNPNADSRTINEAPRTAGN